MQTLTLTRPDDWHLHLRDGALMASVLPDTARQFARAIVMPNLRPPVTSTEMAIAYRERILAALPAGMKFEPLMTLYLTNNTSAAEIKKAKASGIVHAVKLYPAGATTNSDAGVTDLRLTYAALEEMQACGMPLLVHGEVTDSDIDVFDREAMFIERVMQPLLKDMPELRVVFEHITTQDAAQFVASAADNIAATLTPQLLLPADIETRDAPRGTGQSGHQRQQEILPRHRQRPACATHQRERLRLRRLLQRA
jgi:dihydroorotase